jgi:hypothetical protein
MHPGYVHRNGADQGRNSPVKQFVADIRLAVQLYERYLVEALGMEPSSTSDADLTAVEDSYESEEPAGN